MVDVAFRTCPEIQAHRCALAPWCGLREDATQDALDRRKPGASGDQQHRPRVLFTQIRAAQRSTHGDRIAFAQLLDHMGAGLAARHAADMELERRIRGDPCHRILPLDTGQKFDAGELPGGVQKGCRAVGGEMHRTNIVRKGFQMTDMTVQDTRGMNDQFVLGQASNAGITPHLGAAGKNEAACPLSISQREFRALQLVDITIDQFAFATAAIARQAAV